MVDLAEVTDRGKSLEALAAKIAKRLELRWPVSIEYKTMRDVALCDSGSGRHVVTLCDDWIIDVCLDPQRDWELQQVLAHEVCHARLHEWGYQGLGDPYPKIQGLSRGLQGSLDIEEQVRDMQWSSRYMFVEFWGTTLELQLFGSQRSVSRYIEYVSRREDWSWERIKGWPWYATCRYACWVAALWHNGHFVDVDAVLTQLPGDYADWLRFVLRCLLDEKVPANWDGWCSRDWFDVSRRDLLSEVCIVSCAPKLVGGLICAEIPRVSLEGTNLSVRSADTADDSLLPGRSDRTSRLPMELLDSICLHCEAERTRREIYEHASYNPDQVDGALHYLQHNGHLLAVGLGLYRWNRSVGLPSEMPVKGAAATSHVVKLHGV